MNDLILDDDLNSLSDEQLAALSRNGKQEAFGELYVRYISIIRSKAEKYYNMGIDAEDLFQEGLIGLDDAVKSFNADETASFRTYASVCISNRMVSALRRANSKKNDIINSAVSLSDEMDLLSASNTEPESALIEDESFKELYAKLKFCLSEFELDVVLMYIDGYDYKEIAQYLGSNKKSCESAMQRVRKKLKSIRN